MTGHDDRRAWVLAALEAYELPLVRYAQRLVGDAETARDVVQDVFVKLCGQSRDEIGERLPAWLFAVCRNRALDVLRAASRADGLATDEPSGAPGAPLRSGPPASSRETDPADSAEQAEMHRALRLLVDRLPDNQREAIDLWVAGFRYAEIAGVLGVKEGHVRVLVHRGLKSLREHPRVAALLREDDVAATNTTGGR